MQVTSWHRFPWRKTWFVRQNTWKNISALLRHPEGLYSSMIFRRCTNCQCRSLTLTLLSQHWKKFQFAFATNGFHTAESSGMFVQSSSRFSSRHDNKSKSSPINFSFLFRASSKVIYIYRNSFFISHFWSVLHIDLLQIQVYCNNKETYIFWMNKFTAVSQLREWCRLVVTRRICKIISPKISLQESLFD
jgi:hypothetical protein